MVRSNLLTVKDTAEILDQSADNVRRLLRSKKLPGKKIGGRWYVLQDLLEQLPGEEECKKLSAL